MGKEARCQVRPRPSFLWFQTDREELCPERRPPSKWKKVRTRHVTYLLEAMRKVVARRSCQQALEAPSELPQEVKISWSSSFARAIIEEASNPTRRVVLKYALRIALQKLRQGGGNRIENNRMARLLLGRAGTMDAATCSAAYSRGKYAVDRCISLWSPSKFSIM